MRRVPSDAEVGVRAQVREVERAARKLRPDQGRTARRNARRLLSREVRKLAGIVDELFPPPSKRPARPRPKMTRAGRIKAQEERLRRNGWVACMSTNLLIDCSAAGIRAKRALSGIVWVREWTTKVPDSPRRVGVLRAARRDPRRQRAIMSEALLRAGTVGSP